MQDLADTAALIATLDLVISVEADAVHLARVVGQPAWLHGRLGPCWRWLAGRRDGAC